MGGGGNVEDCQRVLGWCGWVWVEWVGGDVSKGWNKCKQVTLVFYSVIKYSNTHLLFLLMLSLNYITSHVRNYAW